MKTIRLIRQNSSLYAYMQIGNNVPRKFRIDKSKMTRISLGTAQLLFAHTAAINELNKQLIQNAYIQSEESLLMREYTSECNLFGETFKFRFTVATDADGEDVIGKDMLQLFKDLRIEKEEVVFDNAKANYTRNENYYFRQYERTNILETMSHYYDDQRRNSSAVRKPYHSKELLQMMDMALDNAMVYYAEQQFAEAELILKRIDSIFWKKIEFDCNNYTLYHYTSTGKFLYLRGMVSLERAASKLGAHNKMSYVNQAFSDLLKASYFFLPNSQIANRICGTLKNIVKKIENEKRYVR